MVGDPELARFFAQAPMPMALMLGPDHEFVLTNEPYRRFIARDPRGRTLREVFSDAERADIEAHLGQVYRTGEPFLDPEYTLRRTDATGHLRTYVVNLAYHPFRDRHGVIIGVLGFLHDVSHEVANRRRVEQSASRLRALFAHAAVGFTVTTLDGRFLETNPRFEEIVGYGADELRGMKFGDLIPGADHARDQRIMDDLSSGRISDTVVEKTMLRKGGARLWVRNSISLIPDDGGQALVFRVAEDVTLLREADQRLDDARRELENEELKFRTIFADSLTSMAVLKGPEFKFEIINRSYAELFPGRDLIGRPFVEALPELTDQAYPRLAREVFETGVPYVDREALARLRRRPDADLEDCYFDQTYRRMDDRDGHPYGVFIHAREVTDRVRARREIEESAERFRIAVETANMGTWDLDPVASRVRWSQRTSELFGRPGVSDVTLDEAMTHIHPDDLERVRDAIGRALDPRSAGDYAIDYRTLLPDGQVRWISVLGKAFFTDTPRGRVATRFTGVILDVTGRMTAEVALRDAKERAELASAAKSAFLANMSHEIRTPLGAIMGFVGLMRDEHLDRASLLEYVTVIERNSVQLMRIIDDILDLSKVEAGMMLIEQIDFSLVELLSDFASLMGFRAREKGIAFELRARTELPTMVSADPTRIRQILTNVVGNAVKFTEVGTVNLFVSYDGGLITFEVIDTGRGITDEQRAQLFQPFTQADVSTTRKYGGTGLGLVLTRRLSEAMGGDFSLVRSEPGVGSTFVATLRVALPTKTAMIRALGFASEPARTAEGGARLRDLSVLLVEDSPDNQALFSIYLGRAGARVAIAVDGARGVDMAMANDYDVVLMDVQMPVMDGIAAVRALRARGFTKPIVALTAHAMKEERRRCLDAGYDEFLSKPVSRADLIDALVRYSPVDPRNHAP